MFDTQLTLQQVITESGVLGTRPPSADGWHSVKCQVCNDYKYRGGFNFSDGGCSYHCFNCGFSAVYRPEQSRFSEKMQTVLRAFHIDLDRACACLFNAFATDDVPAPKKIDRELLPAKPIDLPKFLFPLNPQKHKQAVEYIESRGLSIDSTKWHVSIPAVSTWSNRVIVPVYNHRDQLVFYQGRTYVNAKKRWESPKVPKSSVIFNHKALYSHSTEPLIVCEGMFDALSVDGVAILGSEFSKYQLAELAKYKGQKIVVPNKDGNGFTMGKQALNNGMVLSFPDFGSCDDINSALVKYGRMYIENQIYTSVVENPIEAEMKLGIWTSS